MTISNEMVQAEYERVRVLNDAALDAELSTVVAATAASIAKIAAILRAKEERGHDISGIRLGMVRYLRMVSDGKLLPEAVATFGHRKQVLHKLAGLPPKEQEEFCSGKKPIPHQWTHQTNGAAASTTSRTGSIRVDPDRNAIVVTGVDVVITAKELAYYQSKLDVPRQQMCGGCGEIYGSNPPPRCPKCGGCAFEPASALLVA